MWKQTALQMKQFLTFPNPNCWINNSLLISGFKQIPSTFFFRHSLFERFKSAGNNWNTSRHPWHARYERRRLFSVSALHVQILSINVRRSSEGGGWQTVKAQCKSFLRWPYGGMFLSVFGVYKLSFHCSFLPPCCLSLQRDLSARGLHTSGLQGSESEGTNAAVAFSTQNIATFTLWELFAEKGLMRRINLQDVRVSFESLM